jgi:hypothetical protein
MSEEKPEDLMKRYVNRKTMLQVALKIYDEKRWVRLIWLMIGTNGGLF